MKKKLIVAFVTILALFTTFLPMRVSAVELGNDPICTDPGMDSEALKAAGCPTGEEEEVKIGDVAQNIINVVIAVLGIVAVVFMVIGGVGYTTSQGDPNKTNKAKNTILYAILGVILAVLAYTIVNFVLANLFNGGGAETEGQQAETNGCIFCDDVLY